MRILITGINGFVGSNLVETLNATHTIYGLDIVSPEKLGVVKTFSWSDVENNSLPMVDAIIHLAGKAHDTKNRTEAQSYFDINTGLTQKIFDYFLKTNTSKFIFFSSVKAAADSVVGDFLTEEVVPTPIGPYGESKIRAEEYIKSHFDFAIESDKRVYIVRPCMIHGPGNKGNLNLLYNIVSRGIPWPLGAFENRRSFTSIDNLSFIIDGMLIKPIQSGIYHIADDQPLSTNELISTICTTLGLKARIWSIPKSIVVGLAAFGSIFRLPLNKDRLNKLTENYVVSNNKLKQSLGVAYLPVTAKEGLIKTIKSFKNTK